MIEQNVKIEPLMLRVLQWAEKMKEKKQPRENIEQMISIYKSLDDQANLNFHIHKLTEQRERLIAKEKYYRDMLAEKYELAAERIYKLENRPNKGVGLSLYEQKMIAERVMR